MNSFQFISITLLIFNQCYLNSALDQLSENQYEDDIDLLIPKALPLKQTAKPICDLQCPFNEMCEVNDFTNRFECVCPERLNFFRIKNECREVLGNMNLCRLYEHSSECPLNEECLSTNRYSKEGTCQCKIGFRRDPKTLDCKKQYLNILSFHSPVGKDSTLFEKSKKRRKPEILETPSKFFDEKKQLLRGNKQNIDSFESIKSSDQDLFDKLMTSLNNMDKGNDKYNEEALSKLRIPSKTFQEKIDLTNTEDITKPATINNPTTTLESTTTSTTTRSVNVGIPIEVTDAPKIQTENLIANAGEDIHVHYPSKVCILNGTLSKILNFSKNKMNIKWIWTKLDTSPAFGKFSGSNENPIAYYENMVQGIYRFVLKIYTDEFDQEKNAWISNFSQDTVDVFVHSSYVTDSLGSYRNSSKSSDNHFKSRTGLKIVYDNLIQIELDYKPEEFTQFNENKFIKQLEILLSQTKFNFNNPKVILTNTRISSGSKSSHVILEFFVCEDLNQSSQKNKNTFDFKKYAGLEEDSTHASLVNNKMATIKQNIIESAQIVRLLKQKSLSQLIINSTLVYVNKLPEKQAKMISNIIKPTDDYIPGYSELRIIDVSLLTCEIGNFSVTKKCSNHGECDHFTGKCVCNKYWMPNLYLYYLRNDHDLTSGNNCEWNIILVVLGSMSVCAMLAISFNCILKYFFYYLCCCCLCCRKKSKKLLKQKLRNRKDKYRYYNENKINYNEDDENIYGDDSELKLLGRSDSSDNMQDQLNEKKKTFKEFLTKGFKSVPVKKTHKYALLENQDDLELNNKNKNQMKNMIGNQYEQRLGSELTENTDEETVYDKKTSPTSNIKQYRNLV